MISNIKIWKTLQCLMDCNPTTTAKMKQQLPYSEKAIRTYMKECDSILQTYHIELKAIPGKGYFLYGDATDMVRMRNAIHMQMHPQLARMDMENRIFYIIFKLLNANKGIRILDLENELFLTRPSLHNDFKKIKEWLDPYHLALESNRKDGFYLPPFEKRKRKALCHLIQVCTQQLTTFNQPFYPEEFNQYTIRYSLKHPRMQNILKFIHTIEKCNHIKIAEKDMIFLSIMIGVSLDRIEQNHFVSVDNTIKERLANFPILLYMMHQPQHQMLLHTTLPDEEIYYISALFFSLTHTNFDFIEQSTDVLVNTIIEEFMVGIDLFANIDDTSKQALVEGLFYHLRSILDKAYFDYDFTNPLLQEIKEKYHDVYCVAEQMRPIVKHHASIELPDDEIAFLVLHIAAAIERTLQPLKAIFLYEHRYSEIKFSQSLIEAHIKEVCIVKSMKYQDYFSLEEPFQYDVIFSSFPLDQTNKKTFYIPILPNKEYIITLQKKMRKIFVDRNYRSLEKL